MFKLSIWKKKEEKYKKISHRFLRASRQLNILANNILSIERVSERLMELARSMEYTTIEIEELHKNFKQGKRKLHLTLKKDEREKIQADLRNIREALHQKTRRLKDDRNALRDYERELNRLSPKFKVFLRDFDKALRK